MPSGEKPPRLRSLASDIEAYGAVEPHITCCPVHVHHRIHNFFIPLPKRDAAKEVGGVIAYLFEPGQGRKNNAFALNAVHLVECTIQVFKH